MAFPADFERGLRFDLSVFPGYNRRSATVPNVNWWNSLYTWDSGFTGIGLAQLDPSVAVDCLNAYVTEPGDPENAFIQAGTPVPVQHYLFLELWNLTQSHSLLEYFYPRLRQYHSFLAGRLGSSTTVCFQDCSNRPRRVEGRSCGVL